MTPAIYPNMIPNALPCVSCLYPLTRLERRAYVHICHIITSPPLIFAGTHSAEYTGMVALFGPIPSPRQNLAMNRCHHFDVKACATQVALETRQVTKMVPRLPKTRFKGSVSQQPKMAQHKYGAAFTRPLMPAFLPLLSPFSESIPNAYW